MSWPSDLGGRPGPGSLVLEAAQVAGSQPVASSVTGLIVGTVCAVILATTGQTVQAEGQVLARIDQAGTRTITVTDVEGRGEIHPSAVERIASLSATESVVGLGPARDGRNAAIGPGGQPVAARNLYGVLPDPPVTRTGGRAPGPGESLVGVEAAEVLGFSEWVGGVDLGDGTQTPVVGWVAASEPLSFLDRGILVRPTPDERGPLRSISVLARTPEQVAPLAQAVEWVLDPADPSSIRIDTSETLAQLRAVVEGELGRFGRRLITLVLGVGLVLVALNVYGSVTLRRRDYGRRRALGASRGAIVGLVATQTLLVGILGALAGSLAGAALVWRWTHTAPDGRFLLGVAGLAVLSALGAGFPPALVAAYRDPIRVLRVP